MTKVTETKIKNFRCCKCILIDFFCSFGTQSAFMNNPHQHLSALQDIRTMMEKSSRFISLSGFSGIAAGTCALMGAWAAYDHVYGPHEVVSYADVQLYRIGTGTAPDITALITNSLFQIAAVTFLAALISSFIFTYIKSRKDGIPIWGKTARRLLINVCVPLLAGGLYLLKLVDQGSFGLIAPGCLIFYGLALLNGSKFTLNEIKYLGYGQLALGIINLWFTGYGLYFWAVGFGILHIVYGIVMWYRYDRGTKNSEA